MDGVRRKLVLMAAVVTVTSASTIVGQAAEMEYPRRPVRIIVPLGAASAVDLLTRVLAQGLSEAWGQQFVVENRPGAAGTVGAQSVAKAAPDGYTLLVTTNAPLTTNLALYRDLDYSWKDFEPILVVAQAPVVLVVNNSLAVRSVTDLVAVSKATPSGLSVATTGNGSIGHFVISDLRRTRGANLANVPYRGGVPGVSAVSTGEVQAGVLDTGAATSFILDGRVRPLAIVGDHRSPRLPDVPTLAELGISGADIIAWVGLVAPKGTPKEIVHKLAAQVAAQLRDPQVRQKFEEAGVEPVDGSTPERFAGFLRDEVARWRQRVQDAGLKLE
ncbi:MAG TPA: tripartite tricarboxylate transporter substrate binding protein [Alphaproteobacteria bacterium]